MERSNDVASVAFRLEWDVFLSFRGDDTRDSFTIRLYKSLRACGVRAFMDDEGLSRGGEIERGLVEAIEDSAAAVVIFSPRYGESRWCLEELAKISESCGDGSSNYKLLLPVFYRVDPSDVRRQKGPFEEAFRAHEERFGVEKVGRWRKAMAKLGGIAGWVFKDSEEAKIIQSLVKCVLSAIRKTPIGLADYTVGLEPKVEELIKLLDLKSNGVRVLGIHGIGGVGKTTLAKALFNKLVGHGFKLRSFIPNVREVSAQEDGLKLLQNKLVDDISKGLNAVENEMTMDHGIKAATIFKRAVLVVLDDVDHLSQLNALITTKKEWLFEGSRVIITTRNREVLQEHTVNVKYEIRELDLDKALQLFSHHALRREKPPEDFMNLSEQIVSLTGGLPLALEVFGSMMFDKRRVEEWKDAIQKLKQIRPANLQDVLKISYDGLDEEEKSVFLDIACLFVKMGMDRDYAIDILKGCGFDAEIVIVVLTAKSLIKITSENNLWMHDQIRDMGRQIVKHENIIDPCMRSRLWNRDDVMTVFLDDKRRKNAQGIVLDLKRKSIVKDVDSGRIAWNNFQTSPNLTNVCTYIKETFKQYKQNQAEKKIEFTIRAKSLVTMPNLRLLQVNYVNLEGQIALPANLKWLQWKECPLKYLPSNFCAPGLAVLDLSDSKVERVWDRYSNKVAENLKVLNLSECYYLAALPNLSTNQKMEKLFLKNCVNLTKIDEFIGNMNSLVHLDLTNCRNLVKLPCDVSGLKCLETMILSGCMKLKELPDNIGSMRSLKVLLVDETAIESVPQSIFRLTKLESFSLKGCKGIKRLPHCIGKLCSLKQLSLDDSGLEELPGSVGSLENLETLRVMWCSSLSVLPDSIGDLKLLTDLLVSSSSIKELPDSVGSLPNLKELALGKGNFINKLPHSIGRLHSLIALKINETSITYLPEQMGSLKSLKTLELWKCKLLASLPETIGDMLSLTNLVIYQGKIKELPESIGMLENLAVLRLTFCKELLRLPDSIGQLKSLNRLLLQETAVTKLPQSFGMLSSLVTLNVSKNPWVADYDESKGTMVQSEKDEVFFPTSFSNLSLLTVLDAHARRIAGHIPDDFERLASIKILNLSHNNICSLPSSLRGLSVLKELLLSHCRELKSLPPLPSSLVKLDVKQCISLEYVYDLSNLESLEELNLTSCEKVQDIPGLECLKSLKRLFMSCCKTCSLVTKRRLAKASLRKIRNLSMPGSKIPDWFTQDVITFTGRKNRPIKGVTVAVVVSLNHQIQDDMKDRLPGIVDIQAQILNQNFPVFTTALNLSGIPNKSEDQVHLCRYSVHSPFVLQLKDGFKIVVTKKNPPYMKGVELKKWGVHLIYEGDDDYEGDEESLNESQQSTSEKLAKYFSTYEDDNYESRNGFEAELEVQESKGEEGRTYLSGQAFSFPNSLIALSLLVLFFSWFYSHIR